MKQELGLELTYEHDDDAERAKHEAEHAQRHRTTKDAAKANGQEGDEHGVECDAKEEHGSGDQMNVEDVGKLKTEKKEKQKKFISILFHKKAQMSTVLLIMSLRVVQSDIQVFSYRECEKRENSKFKFNSLMLCYQTLSKAIRCFLHKYELFFPLPGR